MKKSICITLLLTISFFSKGQNFLANPGFEEVNSCEEYGAKCAPEAWFRIPPADLSVTGKALRQPFQGKTSEMVVIENVKTPVAYRVFLYSKFLCPLQEGHQYQLTFFLNTLKLKEYKIEILLSEEELISGEKNPIRFKPTLILTNDDEISFNKETNWRKLQTTYTATGNEKFITIGNFSKESIFVKKKKWSNKGSDIVFLIDNISFKPLDENELLCNEASKAKEKLYAANHRHTNKISVDAEPMTSKQVIDNFFEKPLGTAVLEKPKTPPPSNDVKEESVIENNESEESDILVLEVPFVAFDFDQTAIKDEYETLLDEFATKIRNFEAKRMEIIGHTDSMGSESYNQNLSERRAKSVYNFLQAYPYVKILPYQLEGRGEREPKAENNTIEGRQLNRRVEIILYR